MYVLLETFGSRGIDCVAVDLIKKTLGRLVSTCIVNLSFESSTISETEAHLLFVSIFDPVSSAACF